ncbi:hypothetical protein DV737_g3421, partial [Chaetothyriales sp. CBS 132003]
MTTTNSLEKIFHWAESQQDGSIPSFETRPNDRYKDMAGFNNNFESEAIPGVIPKGQNSPRVIRFGLLGYIARVLRSHIKDSPFEIPKDDTPVDFVDGLKTLAGSGDPTMREGLATHVYLCNRSMDKTAFVNSDGDFLIVPQQRFKVNIAGPTRGYILEVWGSNFELPELGPLGANGLANARDFLHPVAAYEVTDNDPWDVVYKLGGKFFKSSQRHCPFDVIAWHGNYVPYKYDLTKFVNVGSISVDHIDPSIFCVLTAKSRHPTAPLADFLIFSPRWDVASHAYRPPYYHRNCASELMGLIYGDYAGRSDDFKPGSVSFECSFVHHGVAYEQFAMASKTEPPTMRISQASIAFTKHIHQHDPKMWDDLVDNFSKHRVEVDKILGKSTEGKHHVGT